MAQTEQYLQQGLHATVIIRAYRKALEDCIEIMKTKASVPVDVKNREEMLRVVKTCIGTKYLSRWLVDWLKKQRIWDLINNLGAIWLVKYLLMQYKLWWLMRMVDEKLILNVMLVLKKFVIEEI